MRAFVNLGIESSRECVVMKTAVGRDSGRCFCMTESKYGKNLPEKQADFGVTGSCWFWVILEVYCAQGDFQSFAVQVEGGAQIVQVGVVVAELHVDPA